MWEGTSSEIKALLPCLVEKNSAGTGPSVGSGCKDEPLPSWGVSVKYIFKKPSLAESESKELRIQLRV